MSSSLSILIVGAGELGTEILTALANHHSRLSDATFAVLLRAGSVQSPSPEKQASNNHLRSLGASLVPGSFVDDDISSLAAIFKNYDIVIQAGGYGLPRGTQIKSATAALQAGVRRYFPWQFGVDYDAIGQGSAQELFDEMLQVRRLLRSQAKTRWTIISTGLFMSYLFLSEFGVVDLEHKTARALGGWGNRVTVTTLKDIGRMTAEMVYVADGALDNKVVFIGGETVSYEQLAHVLDNAFGEKFKREEWDMEFLRHRSKEHPDNLWYKYQCIFGDGTGVSWDVGKTLNGQKGIKMTAVREYIEQTYYGKSGSSKKST